jgi:YkoY family integral membrane protein
MLDQVLNSSSSFNLQTPAILLVLIALEAVLSADNAIALAAIAQGLGDKKQQKLALNIGLVFAYILRIILILTATWVVQFWQFELLGAIYLLWLVLQYFTSGENESHQHHSIRFNSVWQAIPLIAVTSIAVSDQVWLILLGGTAGVITLRFLAGLFIRWLDEYTHLEDAGFVTVGLVGLRLLVRVINEDYIPPEWLMISAIVVIFIWGFSEKSPEEDLKP